MILVRAANPGGYTSPPPPPIFDLHPPPNNFDFCLACPEIFPPCCNGKYMGGGGGWRKMQDGKN